MDPEAYSLYVEGDRALRDAASAARFQKKEPAAGRRQALGYPSHTLSALPAPSGGAKYEYDYEEGYELR